MRDKNRIQPFLDELGEQWSKVPDWRFLQIISNIFADYPRDIFYIEDDEAIRIIKEYFK